MGYMDKIPRNVSIRISASDDLDVLNTTSYTTGLFLRYRNGRLYN